MLDFATYQLQAQTTAVYPGRGQGNYTYPALGLAGETGEVCEKLKKAIRDEGGSISPERKALLAKELGDVLWYIAALSTELGLSLEEIASGNLSKLAARKAQNKIHGDGDLR
jgi:NTP pyrophosphatase (non-canonical NTP hydrolase)